MAGGRHITDHSFWAGGKPSGEVFPHGPHKVQAQKHADGFGELSQYEDTNEKIVSMQDMAKKKVHGHPHKPLYRN